jgi:hypothetical protein
VRAGPTVGFGEEVDVGSVGFVRVAVFTAGSFASVFVTCLLSSAREAEVGLLVTAVLAGALRVGVVSAGADPEEFAVLRVIPADWLSSASEVEVGLIVTGGLEAVEGGSEVVVREAGVTVGSFVSPFETCRLSSAREAGAGIVSALADRGEPIESGTIGAFPRAGNAVPGRNGETEGTSRPSSCSSRGLQGLG